MKKHSRWAILGGLLASMVAIIVYSHFSSRHETRLGTLGGGWSEAIAISDNGWVLGRSANKHGAVKYFLWSEKTGMRQVPGFGKVIHQMNRRGDLVGSAVNWKSLQEYTLSPAFANEEAADWISDTHMDGPDYDIMLLQEGGTPKVLCLSGLQAVINDHGQVAGTRPNNERKPRAFYWNQAAGLLDINIPNSYYSEPMAINAKGQVAGNYSMTEKTTVDPFGGYSGTRAFVWTKEAGYRDLGTLGGEESYAWNISDQGEIFGESQTGDGKSLPFIWTESSGMVKMAALGGDFVKINAINRTGQAAGTAMTPDGSRHAFIWTKNEGMKNLGAEGEWESIAYAINDKGQVTGSTEFPNGQKYAFVWTKKTGTRKLGAIGHYLSSVIVVVNNHGQVAASVDTTPWWIHVWHNTANLLRLPDKFHPDSGHFTCEAIIWAIPDEE